MAPAIRNEGDHVVLNGHHASVHAQVVHSLRPQVRVTVNAASGDRPDRLRRAIRGSAPVYYEGPAGADQVRTKVVQAGSEPTGSRSRLIFMSTGPLKTLA